MFTTKLSSLFAFVCLVLLHAEDVEGIINGMNTTSDEFPFMASIQSFGKHLCGGAILTSKFIVTAASCVRRKALTITTKYSSVVYGTTQLSRNQSHRLIERILVHELYRFDTLVNDIALLKLIEPISSDPIGKTIGFAALPKSELVDKNVTVTGWGSKSYFTGKASDILQKVELSIISLEFCKEAHSWGSINITQNNLCAADPQKDVGPGNVGDPMTVKGVLHGIVSRKILSNCPEYNEPVVFTAVFKYVEWIKQTMKM